MLVIVFVLGIFLLPYEVDALAVFCGTVVVSRVEDREHMISEQMAAFAEAMRPCHFNRPPNLKV